MPVRASSALPPLDATVQKPIDLRLLSQFVRLVDAGGFGAARSLLNVSPSTLSGQIAALERRLGMRLCERGRGGFRLTDQGRTVYKAAQSALGAVGKLESEIAEARGEHVGVLTIGMVDNIATNPACRIADALATFKQFAPDVSVNLKVASPAELERHVVTGEHAIAIGVLMNKDRALRYAPLFDEQQYLYCGAAHPLFGRTDDSMRREELKAFDYVARGYLQGPMRGLRTASTAWHMEAIALMVQSGAYLGHLPEHYARRWVQERTMQPVLHKTMGYRSHFACVSSRSRNRSVATEKLIEILVAAHEVPAK